MARLEQPVILGIETAGLACSAAIGVGGRLASAERIECVHGQAEMLLPLVDRVMVVAGLLPNALDIVASTVGPGSFTGIRVGLAAARGIALAAEARLFGISSFDAVAAAVATRDRERDRFVLVALESRREDLYVRLFNPLCNAVDEAAAIMPAALADTVTAAIGRRRLLIAGDAAHRAGQVLARCVDAVVLASSAPDATGLLAATLSLIQRGKAGAATRPHYLRRPDVAPPGWRRRPGPTLS